MATIFSKIINKEIPATVVYEDDLCLAFKDIQPQAPTHLLLIPKKEIPHLDALNEQDASLMGHLMTRIPLIAKEQGLKKGYRIVCNCRKDGGQEVPHLHIHILGGRAMQWPPG